MNLDSLLQWYSPNTKVLINNDIQQVGKIIVIFLSQTNSEMKFTQIHLSQFSHYVTNRTETTFPPKGLSENHAISSKLEVVSFACQI